MCFTVQLSKIGFALPFVSNSFAIISCRFLPVKNFFQLFSKLFLFLSCSNFDILSHPTGCCQELFHFFFTALCQTQLVYVITSLFRCQELFSFLSINAEGGIWTLARRKPSIPLAGAPLQPLEYFCKCLNINIFNCIRHSHDAWISYQSNFLLSIGVDWLF